MDDRSQEVFNQYEFKIYGTYRARGAVVLDTEEGLKLCRSFTGSEKRLEFEDCVKKHLISMDFLNVDGFVRNREGQLVSEDQAGEKYVIRDWFEGEECSLKRRDRAFGAAASLAWLHECLRGVEVPEEYVSVNQMKPQDETFEKRNRELKRVKSYIREKRQKNNFETQYLKICDAFYEQACEGAKLLSESACGALWQDAFTEGTVCHGNYNYHNILVIRSEEEKSDSFLAAAELPEQMEYAITNFDKAVFGPQVTDLYQFLRKAMEKNDWNVDYGMRLLEEYNKVRSLSDEEVRLLYILLLYPEKFWKITNYYYNGKKSWIPQKNIQKLIALDSQTAVKNEFLSALCECL